MVVKRDWYCWLGLTDTEIDNPCLCQDPTLSLSHSSHLNNLYHLHHQCINTIFLSETITKILHFTKNLNKKCSPFHHHNHHGERDSMFSVGARHKGRRVTAQNRSNTLYLLRDHLGGDSDRDDEEDDGDDVDNVFANGHDCLQHT